MNRGQISLKSPSMACPNAYLCLRRICLPYRYWSGGLSSHFAGLIGRRVISILFCGKRMRICKKKKNVAFIYSGRFSLCRTLTWWFSFFLRLLLPVSSISLDSLLTKTSTFCLSDWTSFHNEEVSYSLISHYFWFEDSWIYYVQHIDSGVPKRKEVEGALIKMLLDWLILYFFGDLILPRLYLQLFILVMQS